MAMLGSRRVAGRPIGEERLRMVGNRDWRLCLLQSVQALHQHASMLTQAAWIRTHMQLHSTCCRCSVQQAPSGLHAAKAAAGIAVG